MAFISAFFRGTFFETLFECPALMRRCIISSISKDFIRPLTIDVDALFWPPKKSPFESIVSIALLLESLFPIDRKRIGSTGEEGEIGELSSELVDLLLLLEKLF